MNIFMVIILWILMVSVIGIILFIIYLYTKEEKIFNDYNFCFNFMAHKTNGRAYGREIKVEEGSGGRQIIHMRPHDLNLSTIRKKIKIDDEKFIVDRNMKISLPVNSLSKEKNINIYVPNDPSEFPKEFKNTEFGKFMMFYVALKSADNSEISALQEGIKRQKQHIENMGWGELSEERVNMIEGLYKDVLNNIKNTKRDLQSNYQDITGRSNIGGI